MPWPPGPTLEGNTMTTAYLNASIPDIHDRLHDKALQESAEYVEAHYSDAPMIFGDHNVMYYYIANQFKHLKEGTWLEFGVWSGTSINYFSEQLPQLRFYGFDSFHGLPEDWSSGFTTPKGMFDLKGDPPCVSSNVTLIEGLFEHTLHNFVQQHYAYLNNLVCLYIDSDLCSSAVTILYELDKYIQPGLFILFDEYLGFPRWKEGEFKAWQQFAILHKIKYRYRAFNRWQALIEITGRK